MAPSGDDVRRQLDRLLASALFANAGRMSRFLKFVVEQNARRRRPSASRNTSSASRSSTATPTTTHASIRSSASRPRGCAPKLAEYYAGEGRGDAVVLSLPKGGYAAVIKLESGRRRSNGARDELRGAVAHAGADAGTAAAALLPRVAAGRSAAVLAVAAAAAVVAWAPWAWRPVPDAANRRAARSRPYPERRRQRAARERTSRKASRPSSSARGRFAVVASSAARAEYSPERRPRDIAAALDADVLIEARVTTDGDRVRVEARAMSGGARGKVVGPQLRRDASPTRDALEREIASAVADAVERRASELERVDYAQASAAREGGAFARALRASPTRSADGSAARARSPSRR